MGNLKNDNNNNSTAEATTSIKQKDMDHNISVADLHPMMIHRILLTNPSQFSTLSMSGKGNTQTYALTYHDFENYINQAKNNNNNNTSSDIHLHKYSKMNRTELVMKRAYRDHILEKAQNTNSTAPLQSLLLELHTHIRSLIPNRKDLHNILKDDNIEKINSDNLNVASIVELLVLTIQSAQALQQLESQVEAETSQAWIQHATTFISQKQQQQQNTNNNKTTIQSTLMFLTNSLLYLLYKVEVCQSQKEDFYLRNVWAPYIHENKKQTGYAMERKAFQVRFGTGNSTTAPITREWIQTLVATSSVTSKDERKKLIHTSFIQDILFLSRHSKSRLLPEIFALDHENIQSIRQTTSLAAAGSALILYASGNRNATNNSNIVFRQKAFIEELQSIQHRTSRAAKEQYVNDVAHALVYLAKEYNSTTCINEETCKGRTLAALSGQDHVQQLLDKRIKETFLELISSSHKKRRNVPMTMKSGYGNKVPDLKEEGEEEDENVRKLFRDRGLEPFASDLATVVHLTEQMVRLAFELYYEDLLKKFFG